MSINPMSIYDNLLQVAVLEGNEPVAKWLYEKKHCSPCTLGKLLQIAVDRGHIAIVNWLSGLMITTPTGDGRPA